MKKSLILIISILVFSTGHSQNSTKTNSSKDFYNTKNIKTIYELGNYKIKIIGDRIFFNKTHGNISSPLEYNNLINEFNFNNLYQIKDSLNNNYYFRFGWVSFQENETIYSYIKWLDDNKPEISESFINFKFSVVNIDFIQFGNKTLCTIGDSQTWLSNAQSLRKFINESNENLIFIGSNTDIYGYGHEGEGGNNTSQLIKRINNMPKADYYTLLIGTNDYWAKDIERAYLNIIEITDYLINLNPDAKILYLTPIPAVNKERELFNTNLKEKLLLKFKENKNIIVLNLGEELRKNKNWKSDYLRSDGLHQNTEGVRFTGKLIGGKIKTITNDY